MAEEPAAAMQVELVFALRERQRLLRIALPEGGTVQQAIDRSGIAVQFPQIDFADLQAGVWGKPVPRDHALQAGDRVEIYRPLEIDPRETRRTLAAQGRLMGGKPAAKD